ncbi:TPA: hypothetical protein ACRNVW_006407 [Pseudomonas aeruginosa]
MSDDDFHVKRYLHEIELRRQVQEDLERRVLPWEEVLKLYQGHDDLVRLTSELGIDWAGLKRIDTGSRFTGSNLVKAIQTRHTPVLRTADGRAILVKRLVQRDRYPECRGIHFISREISAAVEQFRREFDWSGAVSLLPMPVCTGLIPIKLAGGQLVNSEALALGPVESAMLASIESGHGSHTEDFLFVWFGFEYGLPVGVLKGVA